MAAVVLAAGAGTRMRSKLPKPLHPVAGRPMVELVVGAVRKAGADDIVLVLSRTLAAEHSLALTDVQIAIQEQPRGTGDALASAFPHLHDAETIVVVFADHPLLLPESLSSLLHAVDVPGVRCALLTCRLDDIAGYGRIIRDGHGRVTGIIERTDDDPGKRLGPAEANSGMMALDAAWARAALPRIQSSPATGELYLTELPALAVAEQAQTWPVLSVEGHPDELVGINDRLDLARADELLRARIRRAHMADGVSMILPETILIDADVRIGPDTTLLPGAHLLEGSTVGSDCVIGPNSVVRAARIGDRCVIESSYVTASDVRDDVHIGPFSHLRGGTRVEPHVHIGNFAELKNAAVASDVRVGHVSYLGDVTVGERTNIGAGTITCNWDGKEKHPTTIGRDVFVGSDTMLVAPVTLEDGAATGAGAVVRHDVPAGVTVVGVPATPLRKRSGEGEGSSTG